MSETDAAAPGPADDRAAASDRLLAGVIREESGRIVGALTGWLGSLDLAEEAVAEAIEEARAAVARARACRRIRARGSRRPRVTTPSTASAARSATARSSRCSPSRTPRTRSPRPVPDEPDERLPLLFGCCHPALSPDAQLALTLRAVCGLTTAQIARATLTPESTVAQRIVRAKRKIGATGIPLRIPEGAERAERLDIVLSVVSVMYSEAHLVAGGDAAADRDLADDAVWLARVVAHELPREAEAQGLLALLLFHRAREGARAVEGELVLLADQDRARWDRAPDRRGAVGAGARGDAAAAGALAASRRDRGLPHRYPRRRCDRLAPGAHALRHAARVRPVADRAAEPRGGARRGRRTAGGAWTRSTRCSADLAGYHLWHAVRARMLRGLGRDDEAMAEDLCALELTANDAERRLLAARIGR